MLTLSFGLLFSVPVVLGAQLSHSQILALYPNPPPLPPPRYTSLAPSSTNAPPSTLRAAASARGIYIGAAINQACYTNTSEPEYQQTFLAEFNLATCENGCKFYSLEVRPARPLCPIHFLLPASSLSATSHP
jgi:hypothetical protein